MASFSESGFNARLNNAEQLYVLVSGFKDFTPSDGLDLETFRKLLDITKAANSSTTTARQAYSLSAEKRAKLFFKEPGSVEKMMSPLLGYLQSVWGNDVKEYKHIAALATKIRGAKGRRPSANTDEKHVSQSQRSFGSVAGNMMAVIDHVKGLGKKYAPANESISLSGLEGLLATCEQSSRIVGENYEVFKMEMGGRDREYQQLKEFCKRVKGAVKGQYGNDSDQYKLVKGLNI